jgi:hypothetical protein
MSSVKSLNNKINLLERKIKYGDNGGINVDAGALFVNGSNGRVGVNTIFPQSNLDVSGNITTNANIISNGNIDVSGYYRVNNTPINNNFYPALSTSTTEKAISIWTNGNNTSPNLSSWNCITWSPELGLFAMVRQGGGTNLRIATSPDGINWSLYKSSNKSYQGILWCNDLSGVGMFVATAANNPTGQEITISTDGLTWTDISTPSGFFAYGALAYSPELRRVVATSYSNGYIYSDDGYNWNGILPTQPINNFYSITWSPKLRLFVTVSAGTNNPINVSPDGINWSYYRSSPPNSTMINIGITWSPELGIFCCVGDGQILISSDGVNWNTYSSLNIPSRNLTWSPELRIFLGGGSSSIRYSYNGINWFTKEIGFNGAKASVWSPELGYFLIGGDRFHTTRSFFEGRNPTSYNVFDSSFNNINDLGLWNFKSFGRMSSVTKITDFTVQPGENWIIINNALVTTANMPQASQWPGLEIMMKSLQNSVVSTSSNIVPLSSTVAGTAILSSGGQKWATLVSDGTNWIIMQSN